MLSRSLVVYLALLVLVSADVRADIADPIPTKIAKGPITVELKTIATGLVGPNDLTSLPGGSDQLVVVDQGGLARVIQGGVLSPTPLVDLSSRLVPLMPGYDERGFLGLAFNPGFADPSSPGYHKFYTYTSQPIQGTADFTVPLPQGAAFNHQSVVNEWQVSAQDPARVDPNIPPRGILRIDEPQFNHNGGMLAFGPDHNLYISLGDGGNANDVGDGHNPAIGNGQDMSTVLGKILRIDVGGNNSANHQYGIPADNPFVSGGGLPEIYASGFRNPFRLSFDSATGDLIVGDVGQNKIEEIDRVVKGGNYGWHVKEGTFLFDPATGGVTANSPAVPAGLIDPLAQYDHDEGIAILGGFVYHGTAIPELIGKYVFGDFSRGFGSPDGRLFYADLSSGLIQEFKLGLSDRQLGMFVKGFGEDASGELYLLASTALGPSGATGQALQIVPIPEPSTIVLVCLALGSLGSIRIVRRSRRLIGGRGHE